VILEAARNHFYAIRQQSGGKRVALITLQAAAIELEAQRTIALDQSSGGEPKRLGAHPASLLTKRTAPI
jgi:hypothetical protein